MIIVGAENRGDMVINFCINYPTNIVGFHLYCQIFFYMRSENIPFFGLNLNKELNHG